MHVQVATPFETLNDFTGPIPLDDLLRWLQTVDMASFDLERYVRFHQNHYLRNLVHEGPAFHALLLCWRPGQRSPIHDHAGSACGVKVLSGKATETLFDRAPNGMIYPTCSRTLESGEVCASQDADIHQVSNLQPVGSDLITLHVYSPPLLSMNTYSLTSTQVRQYVDPINQVFVGGMGI